MSEDLETIKAESGGSPGSPCWKWSNEGTPMQQLQVQIKDAEEEESTRAFSEMTNKFKNLEERFMELCSENENLRKSCEEKMDELRHENANLKHMMVGLKDGNDALKDSLAALETDKQRLMLATENLESKIEDLCKSVGIGEQSKGRDTSIGPANPLSQDQTVDGSHRDAGVNIEDLGPVRPEGLIQKNVNEEKEAEIEVEEARMEVETSGKESNRSRQRVPRPSTRTNYLPRQADGKYHCPKCDKKYASYRSRNSHLDSHSPKECKLCKRTFLYPVTFKKHLKKCGDLVKNKKPCTFCRGKFLNRKQHEETCKKRPMDDTWEQYVELD